VTGTGGQEIQAHAAIAAAHARGIHAVAAQLTGNCRAEGVVGQHADHRHVVAKMCQRYADVGLGTAGVDLQRRRLQQQLVAGCAQAQQQLAKTDNTGGNHRHSCLLVDRRASWHG